MLDLLPPNATPTERRLAQTLSAIDDIPTPLRELVKPASIPVSLLPWLAWQLGVDHWQDYWPEHVKRARVAAAIPIARKKGTAAAVRDAVAAFGAHVVLREWFELTPPGAPGTFEVTLSIAGEKEASPTARLIADITAEIERTKNVRSHFVVKLGVQASAGVGIVAVMRSAIYARLQLRAA
ncbi:phage tail P2-like protein [Robbsia andropogonis]|uniref:phage tail protein I n=1 Tax=Robbsia andropogonis TaxID=28092 RepID=UPI00209E7069|nr:phage tail protein I [Robbsia andropogonis]MCP1126381.1 phage tail protein I [Robbsia andropogonis]